ncbi:hypothetical protein IscW_ISCW011298 [Ixodes scapularis]|uniref:Uncharacterized protein n=1 Tax=Ixodes scapularis TaxID=6945 RepID=B7Q830_IXOSC|nr:hypothetical protein IscW_ISCW011298 [Ixodes scapularis]|eukprot:XP_002412269.1 hypothetical protein IscW_ISCW011298 [Ixodes scapularis]
MMGFKTFASSLKTISGLTHNSRHPDYFIRRPRTNVTAGRCGRTLNRSFATS